MTDTLSDAQLTELILERADFKPMDIWPTDKMQNLALKLSEETGQHVASTDIAQALTGNFQVFDNPKGLHVIGPR